MSIDLVRYGRQVRLPEIGEAGQRRLSASEVVLAAANEAREIEATYLARAGVVVVDDARAPVAAEVDASGDRADRADRDAKAYAAVLAALDIRDRSACDVAEGALRAVVAMRRILGIEGDGGAQ